MKKYQVVGIGNAIVDVIAQCDDEFLAAMGIEKGIMQLIDRDRAEKLYAAMAERTEAPGGSVGNTIAGLGNLGLTAAFNRKTGMFILAGFINHFAQLLRHMEAVKGDFLNRTG